MRRRDSILAAMLVAGLMFIGGCGQMGDADLAPSALADTRWLAEDIDGRGVIDLAQSTIAFQGTERIGGNTGCNRYFASVTLVGDSITVGQIGATRRACPAAVMNQEERFTQALTAASRYAIDGPYLLIYDAAGQQRLRLARLTGPS